jgi:hypothetical protein
MVLRLTDVRRFDTITIWSKSLHVSFTLVTVSPFVGFFFCAVHYHIIHIFHSSDGASLCGVFCAVHNVIQQITLDDVVDVFTAVRQLHVRRPEFCANLVSMIYSIASPNKKYLNFHLSPCSSISQL